MDENKVFEYTKYTQDIEKMKAAHKVLAEYAFTPSLPQKGYNNRSLHVDLSTFKITEKKIGEDMKQTFTGGRGFGLKYLWDAIKPTTKWNDPENDIIISPGPICGITQYPGAGKSLVVTLSPITNIPIDSNVGAYLGPLLKFSGFDALEIQGKAQEDVIVVLDGVKGRVTIELAPLESVNSHIAAEQFTHEYATDEADLRNVSVASAGQAAEHSLIGCLNFCYYDVRRKVTRLKQAGRGGIGTVFRDKKIKALIVHGPQVKGDMNHPADLGRIQRAGVRLHKEMHDFDDKMCGMRKVGTTNIVGVMNSYDLLPVMNFQYGSHVDAPKIDKTTWIKQFTQGIPDGCWYGCSMACAHGVDEFALRTGPYKGHKVVVDGPEYETAAGCGSNCGIFDPLWVIECNFYCDTYGIDTISFGTITGFVMECWQRAILNAERTGGLDLSWGNGESQMEMMHQMARGEGFGLIAGQGVQRMKRIFADKGWGDFAFLTDIGLEGKGLEQSEYMSKESLAQQGGYYLTNKGPQHDEAWVIFMDMVNNQIPTFEDKAEALVLFPDVPHLVRVERPVQAALERHRARGQPHQERPHGRCQGSGARPELRGPFLRGHRPGDHQGGDHQDVGAGLPVPAGLRPENGEGGQKIRPAALPGHGSGHQRGVRIPSGTLRQAAEGLDADRPGRKVHRREDGPAPQVPGGPLPEAGGGGLQAPGLDRRRRPHPGNAEAQWD